MTVAVPNASAAGVNVRTPVELMAGCEAKSELSLLETLNVSVWPDSPGPAEIAEAHAAL